MGSEERVVIRLILAFARLSLFRALAPHIALRGRGFSRFDVSYLILFYIQHGGKLSSVSLVLFAESASVCHDGQIVICSCNCLAYVYLLCHRLDCTEGLVFDVLASSLTCRHVEHRLE